MTIFDDLDAQASATLDASLGSAVQWRPRCSKGPDNTYTNGSDQPDPTRARPDDETLIAIVTWKPDVIGPGGLDSTPGTDRSAIENFEVCVDFDATQFDPTTGGNPREGDYLYLSDEYEGNRLVEIARDGQDGSQRVIYWCIFPQSGETE